MTKKKYRYLLFDLDNTLFDFDRAEKTAFCAAFSAYGLVSDAGVCRLYHDINDGLWKKLERGEITRERLKILRFEMLLDALGIADTDHLSRRISDTYFRLLGEQSFLLPGAVETCHALSGKYRMVIITNGSEAVQKNRYFGSPIELYFEDIFISETVGAEKPSPVFFRYVLENIGNPPSEECCVIGDSLSSDIAGAAALGMDSVWIDHAGSRDTQGHPVSHILHDIRELPAYLGAL